jgi:hypothetical protein
MGRLSPHRPPECTGMVSHRRCDQSTRSPAGTRRPARQKPPLTTSFWLRPSLPPARMLKTTSHCVSTAVTDQTGALPGIPASPRSRCLILDGSIAPGLQCPPYVRFEANFRNAGCLLTTPSMEQPSVCGAPAPSQRDHWADAAPTLSFPLEATSQLWPATAATIHFP